MTHFQDNSDEANLLRAAHLASGRPRYSISIFVAGVRTERAVDDRQAALAAHHQAATRPEVDRVLTFDNLTLDMIAMHFRGDGGPG